MSNKMEVCFCDACGEDTNHVLVLVRKREPAKSTKHKFILGLIKGWFLGPFIASMDDFSRHLVCEKCGRKIIEE